MERMYLRLVIEQVNRPENFACRLFLTAALQCSPYRHYCGVLPGRRRVTSAVQSSSSRRQRVNVPLASRLASSTSSRASHRCPLPPVNHRSSLAKLRCPGNRMLLEKNSKFRLVSRLLTPSS